LSALGLCDGHSLDQALFLHELQFSVFDFVSIPERTYEAHLGSQFFQLGVDDFVEEVVDFLTLLRG